jgi:light-regulated signal transduction histidine kinase (bacteriophytochrome)
MNKVDDPIENLKSERDLLAAEADNQKSHWHKVFRNASHDLKEPLRMVCTYAAVLKAEKLAMLDEPGKEYLQYVIDGATRLRKQTEALLKLFSIEFQEHKLELVSMDEALRCSLIKLKPMIADRQAEIQTSPLAPAWGNSELLEQLITAVLENSIKFAPESKKPRIEVKCRAEMGNVIYSITDDGEGVPKEQLKEIFEPFRRLRPRNMFHGEGLGLSYCHRIVALHHGSIWAESQADGFSVHFSLPIGEPTDAVELMLH